jgi:putative glutamine amidotransferase
MPTRYHRNGRFCTLPIPKIPLAKSCFSPAFDQRNRILELVLHPAFPLSCSVPNMIGITFTEASFSNYPRWILDGRPNVGVVTLEEKNRADWNRCTGIVLSGGVDTHPRFYNNPILQYPNAPDTFNPERDAFEIDLFRFALERRLPILAICRGMQLVNIALGGDLIQDIEAIGKPSHRRQEEKDGFHDLILQKDSLLHRIAGSESGRVNSAHHQALGKTAPELLVVATSPDGLPEAIEWKDKEDKPFFLGVQWHPERLSDALPGNPLSLAVRTAFLNAVLQHPG